MVGLTRFKMRAEIATGLNQPISLYFVPLIAIISLILHVEDSGTRPELILLFVFAILVRIERVLLQLKLGSNRDLFVKYQKKQLVIFSQIPDYQVGSIS